MNAEQLKRRAGELADFYVSEMNYDEGEDLIRILRAVAGGEYEGPVYGDDNDTVRTARLVIQGGGE